MSTKEKCPKGSIAFCHCCGGRIDRIDPVWPRKKSLFYFLNFVTLPGFVVLCKELFSTDFALAGV